MTWSSLIFEFGMFGKEKLFPLLNLMVLLEHSLLHFSFIQNRQKSISADLKNKVTCYTRGEKKISGSMLLL